MSYIDGKVVGAFANADQTRTAEIIERPDGICRYVEHVLDYDRGPYWRNTYHSGLFPDAASARRDAMAVIPWLSQTALTRDQQT